MCIHQTGERLPIAPRKHLFGVWGSMLKRLWVLPSNKKICFKNKLSQLMLLLMMLCPICGTTLSAFCGHGTVLLARQQHLQHRARGIKNTPKTNVLLNPEFFLHTMYKWEEIGVLMQARIRLAMFKLYTAGKRYILLSSAPLDTFSSIAKLT